MKKFSHSEENYLKAIFHLEKNDKVTTTALAGMIEARPSSVTEMLKKLQEKKLLNYKPYYGFRLNVEGRKQALQIIRRHRLWESFLAYKLKFGRDEVHIVAEELEHVNNTKLITRLDEYLGFPQFDPHGDPIPDSEGNFKVVSVNSIYSLPVGARGIVWKISDETKELAEVLEYHNLKYGARVAIIKKFSFDESVELQTSEKPSTTIGKLLAQKIFLKIDE